MSFDKTALDGVLKTLYAGQTVVNMGADKESRPLFTDLVHNPNFGGKKWPQPVIYQQGGAVGADFATVQAAARSSQIAEFEVDVASIFGVATITDDAVERGRNDRGAFVNTLKHMNDTTIQNVYDRIEQQLFGSSDGRIGVVGSGGVNSNVFTLATPADAVKFYVGQILRFAATASSTPRTGTATVTKVDVNSGQVTIDSTPTSTAAGDLIFLSSDYDSSGDRNAMTGLPDWLTGSATSAAFHGVDRTVDEARLAGTIITGSSSDVYGSILDGCRKVARLYGKSPTHAYMGHDAFTQLLSEIDDVVRRTDGKEKTTVGTNELEIYAGKSLVKVRPATHCPDTEVYMLRLEDWYLLSMGEPVRVMMHDGLRIRAQYNAAGYETRWVSRPQLVCKAPGRSCRATLS